MTTARDLQQHEAASPSMTALLVMIGFEIGLKTRYGNYFNKEDVDHVEQEVAHDTEVCSSRIRITNVANQPVRIVHHTGN